MTDDLKAAMAPNTYISVDNPSTLPANDPVPSEEDDFEPDEDSDDGAA